VFLKYKSLNHSSLLDFFIVFALEVFLNVLSAVRHFSFDVSFESFFNHLFSILSFTSMDLLSSFPDFFFSFL